MTTLIISNEETNDMMKLVKSLKGLLVYWFIDKKALTKQLKMKQKNKKADSLVCY